MGSAEFSTSSIIQIVHNPFNRKCLIEMFSWAVTCCDRCSPGVEPFNNCFEKHGLQKFTQFLRSLVIRPSSRREHLALLPLPLFPIYVPLLPHLRLVLAIRRHPSPTRCSPVASCPNLSRNTEIRPRRPKVLRHNASVTAPLGVALLHPGQCRTAGRAHHLESLPRCDTHPTL
jgi:hypothetical protein